MDIINVLKKHETEIKNKYHVKRIGLFGSYARQEENEESDVVLKHFVFGTLGNSTNFRGM
jgi:predicted nucleotidyltransferase